MHFATSTTTTLLVVRLADLLAALGVLLVVTLAVEHLAALLGGEVLLALVGLGLATLLVVLLGGLLDIGNTHCTELALLGGPASLLKALALLGLLGLLLRNDRTPLVVLQVFLHQTTGSTLGGAVHNLGARTLCLNILHFAIK